MSPETIDDTIEKVVKILQKDAPADEVLGSREAIAAASLMVECARVHPEYEPGERVAIAAGVRKLFGLSAEVAGMLVKVAEAESTVGWREALFTDAIKQGFDLEKRKQLMRLLCDVALADGVFHMREAVFIRQIASELGVPEDALSVPTSFVA
ncbi:MAG: TerB family tellurite resistance protein [Myxococcota bacterium]|nr:TerB family tellurite resistance protein [Myxococcota bacterium]